MHGELIEFNERLYRSLMAKDNLIGQMRQELIDLRGPVSTCKHTQAHTHTHASLWVWETVPSLSGCSFFSISAVQALWADRCLLP